MVRPGLKALTAALLLSLPALAGCLDGLDGEGSAAKDSSRQNRSPATPGTANGRDTGAGTAQRDANQTAGERWHFHNYWGVSPLYVVFDGNVSLEWTPGVACCPATATLGGTEFRIPRGRIVPPETGHLEVNLSWTELPVPNRVNLSYRPTGATTFTSHGAVENGGGARIPVTAFEADPPHASESGWAFRLAASPDHEGAGVANGTIHVRVTAVMGRPVFMDPPHPDRWRGGDTFLLARYFRNESTVGAGTPGNALAATPTAVEASTQRGIATVAPLDEAVVPNDAQVILLRLRWQASVPGAPWKLALGYEERNTGSSSVLVPAEEGENERLYRIPLDVRMTDPAYAVRSGWTFEVLPDEEAGAFEGTFSLHAWASRLPADEAQVPVQD